MRNDTRLKFNAYMAAIQQLNGVPDATKKFAVTPSVQQKLETRIQESSAFLQKVNMVIVDEQSGEKLGLGVNSTIAGTTDTSLKDREPTDPTDLVGNRYECTQTNFDTALRYTKIDTWAKFPDFQTRIRDVLVKQQALDRIMIGWNGTSRAATSNRATNPLLQDVNKGWLQKYREDAAARVMKQGATANQIRVGVAAGHDYVNLDALVMDAASNLIAPQFRDDTELVVICNQTLLDDKYFPLVNREQPNSEMTAADVIMSQKRIGGRAAVAVPYFPEGALLITRLDNLSIYIQDGARRRSVQDNPKRDRVENYESSNDAYVIESYEGGCFVENIKLTW
ncbi:phage major capsid protein, P2 family [Massilia dura]|uniref:Phage major capsid protein, P2 family n=1 Tax=Pseudoduganella dura TaxID=321982 RepID=A0A6I3XDM1_9BURK|nr:phage major capsid protein, P2 family [Pseudoduganella dura]MUI10888.1 phage major capsid protein, P2 family [Pseudoduganella dura]GGY12693.1 phage capsid protein [Pseudoduganella dura]